MIRKRESLESTFVAMANHRSELLAKLLCKRYHPSTVGIYWPKGHEFPTQACISYLSKIGVEIYLPVVFGDTMEFYPFRGEKYLSKGSFGVMVPPAEEGTNIDPRRVDTLIIPGVAFDRQFRRLGYGKGYYDRYLPKLKPNTAKIGLAYDIQVLDAVPFTESDQPVDFLFTESSMTL
jgi:5-formyltetrahydrofolate cyclo-ligase